MSTKSLVAAGAVLVGLAAAGGGGGGGGGTSSTLLKHSGVVQDGPVKGATVFFDLNKNGLQDPSEPAATTDAKGFFTITSDLAGPIISTGGINTDTGSANVIVLKAQAGSTIVNPITTLINALVVEQSLTAVAAEAAVKSALGLGLTLDLSTYDPLLGVGDVAYQRVAAKIAVLASTVATASGDGGAAVFSAFATTIKQSGAFIDLTSSNTLASIFSGIDVIASQSVDLAQKNAAIETAIAVTDIAQKMFDYEISQLALSLNVDSGNPNDRITNNGTLVLKDLGGMVTNPTGLQYSVDGGQSFKTDLTTFTAVEDANSLVLRLVADNGLSSKSSVPWAFTLDTRLDVPAIGIASGSVDGVVNDSGLSQIDGNTNVPNPVLSGIAEAGSVIKVVVGGVALDTTTDSTGRWTVALPKETKLADGTPNVAVTITDIAGNVKSENVTAGFTIDTKAPVGGTGGLSATPVNDTGSSQTDGVTANNRPQLSGTAEAGSTVTIDVGVGAPYTTKASSAGTWSADVRAGGELKDGTVSPKITVTDIAGNTVTSIGQTFLVDTVAPATPSLALRIDSGVSSIDEITNTAATAEDFSVGSVEAGTRVEFSLGGGAWSQTIQPLEGANTIQVRAVDVAGNSSLASSALAFTLDTVAPIATGVTGGLKHDEFNDTGVDPMDGITANLAPSLVGTASAGAYLHVEFDAATVFKLPDPVGADGTWVLPVELGYGEWVPTIRILDVAGNSATVAGEKFVILPDGPYEGPVTVELAHTAVSDTGLSLTDNLTNNGSPFLTGIAAPRSAVKVQVGDVSYPVITDSRGMYAVQVTGKLTDGEYTPSIIVLDVDGNPKDPVTGPSFVVDTAIANSGLAAGLVHDLANDTGSDQTDSRTGNASPKLEGTAEPGSKLTVSFAGTTKTFSLAQPVGEDGIWQLPVTLANGTWTPLVQVTDPAGNTLTTSFTGEPFSIDTAAPATTGGLVKDSTNDTGVSDSDGFTSNPRPFLIGKTESGATLKVEVGGQALDVFVEFDTGDWTLNLADSLPDGTYTPLFTATDEFGNVSAPTKGTVFTIDTKAPVFQGQLDNTFVVGSTNVSYALPIRAAGTETLIFEAQDLSGNLAGLGLLVNAASGAITAAKVLAPGSQDPNLYGGWVRLSITDLAGNIGTDEFQIAIVDEVKAAATTYTLDTSYFESTTPRVSRYVGTADAQKVELLQSYRDVIELAAGNDTVNLNGSGFSSMNFARLDGGTGSADVLAFKLEGGADFNLGDFNRADTGQGQVLVNFETIDATATGVDLNWTITPLDLFLQGSDLLDTSTSGGNRPTLVLIGNAGDTLNLPVVDTDSTDAQDQDFVRIGAAGGWSATGAAGTGFTKLQGVVTFEGSVQSVELLVSQAVQISNDIDLGRAYPVIG